MAVAKGVHPDARREVQVSSPLGREEIGAFAALESEVGARIGLHQGVAQGPTPKTIPQQGSPDRSEEHTSELQSLMRISYAVFCLKKKNNITQKDKNITHTRHKNRRI